ncbi:very long chain fatty acid elongase 7-like isoform X2 [Zophobas morio]|uniref:very long chain fatty acid elongase 7-like isoform X2 n=1 Tax=Zophobas morio TaxID=2755281 RepID=UPI003083C507
MAILLEKLISGYREFLTWGDPRVAHLPLMGSPIPLLIILVAYVFFVFEIGPHIMQHREPFNIKIVIMVYNVLQIILNGIGFVMTMYWLPEVNVLCTPLTKPDLAFTHYLYFLLKGGQLFVVGMLNTFVHVVMYIYYFLMSWDPTYKNIMWWKRYLTQLQIMQHCMVFFAFLAAILNPNCTYPRGVLLVYLPGNVLMIYLFVDFYAKTYPKRVLEAKQH